MNDGQILGVSQDTNEINNDDKPWWNLKPGVSRPMFHAPLQISHWLYLIVKNEQSKL